MNRSQKIFFLSILFISFILRINRWDYPLSHTFAWGDGTRDYLVASHIVKYGEFPQTGPYNLLDSAGIKNSPVYFYILSTSLLIYNHPLTLGAVNIFLQIFVLVLIFLTAKQAFGTPTALITLTLFSLNPEIIKQSDYIWQPHLMMPMAYLSLYFFVRGILKKNYKLIFLSLVTISLAFAIHNSAFTWLVILLMGSFLITFQDKKGFKYYLGIIISFVSTLIILYMPVILSSSGFKNLPTQNVSGYLNNLNFNLETFLNVFYVDKLFLAAILLLSTLSLLYIRNELKFLLRNKAVVFGIILFLSPILFASFFDKIRFHYLILSSGVFVILIGNLLDRIKFAVPKFLLLIFLVWIFSGHFQFIRDFKKPLENQMFVDGITEKIVREIPNSQTFQVKSYAKDNTTFYYPVLDTIFLVPLEREMNTKLVKISDASPFNHVQINEQVLSFGNKGDQIVLACYKFHNQNSDCREDFLKDNESYEIKKTIHTSEFISVYLAKQKAY